MYSRRILWDIEVGFSSRVFRLKKVKEARGSHRIGNKTAVTLSQAALLLTLACLGNFVTAYNECFHINKTFSVHGLVYTTACKGLCVCSMVSRFFYTRLNLIVSRFIYLHQCSYNIIMNFSQPWTHRAL